MSRSKPQEVNPSPVTRWFEWGGGEGQLSWFNKEEKDKDKAKVILKLPFPFIVLDTTATVKGYNKKRKDGMYANEVRDTRLEPFIVKWFSDKSKVAEGIWNDIKEKVGGSGGGFCTNCYIAYKEGEELKLGVIQFKGCSLGSWIEFSKKNRKEIQEKVVVIKAGKEDTTGSVNFTPPVFSIAEITPETQAQAVELDKVLQAYLDKYFSRNTVARADHSAAQPDVKDNASQPDPADEPPAKRGPTAAEKAEGKPEEDLDDVPF